MTIMKSVYWVVSWTNYDHSHPATFKMFGPNPEHYFILGAVN